MDTTPDVIIKISRNCDEISAHNFFALNKEKDYSWLIPGYDGWEEITTFPIDTPVHYENIINEYTQITENNSTLQYFELKVDLTDEESRILAGKSLLFQLETRWGFMTEELKKAYIKELHGHRFHFDVRKPILEEIDRIKKQFSVVEMKIEQLKKRIKPFEEDNDIIDIVDVKIKMQNIIKRDIDLKKMSIKEFSKTLMSLKKAA